MWKMMQKNLTTMSLQQENNILKDFTNLVLRELKIKFKWKGKGLILNVSNEQENAL